MKTHYYIPLLSLLLIALVSACLPIQQSAEATVTPTATATATRVPAAPNNRFVEALNQAQARLNDYEYGFAPLLMHDDTTIPFEFDPAFGEVARLAYPVQPANILDWETLDSFLFGHAAQVALLESPHVAQASLGSFRVAVPLDDFQNQVSHTAVWVRFSDGSQAIVDLTPLATNFGSTHSATELMSDPTQIEALFEERRRGVRLNQLQPLLVLKDGGSVYYLLTEIHAQPGGIIEIDLHAYSTQTATPIRPFRLTRGAVAQVTVNRAELELLQEELRAAGEDAFSERQNLIRILGDADVGLIQALEHHYYLLWHLVTKLDPSPAQGSGGRSGATPQVTFTPPPTPTITPTPLPSATPTRPSLPLQTG